MKTQTTKKHKQREAAINKKLFLACKVNEKRKSSNKLWVDVKDEALPIVEDRGGFVIGQYENYDYSLETIKKNTTRFDIKGFKENYPELYKTYLIDGQSIELKTNYKKIK